MTFEELLTKEPVKITNDINILKGCYYSHLSLPTNDLIELNSHVWDYVSTHQDRITIEYLHDHNFDCRRIWALYFVKMDGELVMVCKNAGREGDDHRGKRVFDNDLYIAMNSYISQEITKYIGRDNYSEINDIGKLTDDASEFITFYGDSFPKERY